MTYGIRRRHVHLWPERGDDGPWLDRLLRSPEVAHAFGLAPGATPTGSDRDLRAVAWVEAAQAEAEAGELPWARPPSSVGWRRVGAAWAFAPTEGRPVWELAYAIPGLRDRNAFVAMAVADAWACYLFEHVGIDRALLRTAGDNLAAQAVLRRLGYHRGARRVRLCGRTFDLALLDRAGWAERRRRLEGAYDEPAFAGLTG